MPKKKLNTKQFKKLKKDKRVRKWLPAGLIITGLIAGLILAWLQPPDLSPQNLVWSADDTVTVPGDLAEFLRTQDDCLNYQGAASPRGVGLWGVYQVSQDRFAKIAYGCSYDLSRYIMAVKEGHTWQLLKPTEYFAAGGSLLPNCAPVDQYKIDRSIEPFCIEPNGTPRQNSHE